MYQKRVLRGRVLDALELRAKQFRAREDTYPFRVPHDPLPLHELVEEALADDGGRIDEEELKSRAVMSVDWHDGTTWIAWVITLPSGIHLYCDSDAHETRVLATLKRGSALEADSFFLELLAESSGHAFGIEMGSAPPDRVRTTIADRDFLAHVFVEMFEGTPAQAEIESSEHQPGQGTDFHADVVRWLGHALIAPPQVGPRRRVRRLRDED